ncbi:MAG: hypothetical protein H6737_18425 [Alphaproteobacteria bacterium]|nr:hypothetical protein [Alphaproteobacteria bacterium]
MKRKLLFATALFTSNGAFAQELVPVLEVTRVVTNGKGPSCTFVAEAPDGVEPEVRDAASDTVLAADAFEWQDGLKRLCLTGGGQEVKIRFTDGRSLAGIELPVAERARGTRDFEREIREAAESRAEPSDPPEKSRGKRGRKGS